MYGTACATMKFLQLVDEMLADEKSMIAS